MFIVIYILVPLQQCCVQYHALHDFVSMTLNFIFWKHYSFKDHIKIAEGISFSYKTITVNTNVNKIGV